MAVSLSAKKRIRQTKRRTEVNIRRLNALRSSIRKVEAAIADADTIVMLVDVTEGVTAADIDVADLLRVSGRPVVLAANKADTERLVS